MAYDQVTPSMDVQTAKASDCFQVTVLGSGSSGNCSLVSCGDTHVLIDAGFSAKQIEARMQMRAFDPAKLTAILVTHEHSDHVKSVHTLSHRYKIPLYATEGTFAAAVEGKRFFDWVALVPGHCFKLGDMWFYPISLPHDAADPVGFRVEARERTFAHITDFGYPSGLVRESLKGCDLIVVEANHDLQMLKDGPYPWPLKQRIASRLGHLSNEALFEMFPDIVHDNLKHIVLAHMSETNNDPRLLRLLTKRTLKRLGLPDLPFTIAKQDEPLEAMPI